MSPHVHAWVIYSTALCPPVIEARCWCGAAGVIEEHSREEWKEAFHAPSSSYAWTGLPSRVRVTKDGQP